MCAIQFYLYMLFQTIYSLTRIGEMYVFGWCTCICSNNLCLFISLSFPCFLIPWRMFPVCKYWMKKQNVSFHQFVMSIVRACNSLALLLWHILPMLVVGEIPEEKMLHWRNDVLKLFIIAVVLHILFSFKCLVVENHCSN
jgi:hypothetical protein